MTRKRKAFEDKLDQEANAWFDQTDDSVPFDAFGGPENKKRIGDEIFSAISHNIHKRRVNRFRIASIVATFFAVSIITFLTIRSYRAEQNKIVWSDYRSGAGHFDRLVLSDGSIVYLRPGSVLKAPQEFKGHLREVQLIEGEAFFEVKHDKENPFIVLSGKLKTQVLGTTFLIKNYRALKNIQVSVATGKVAVINGKKLLGFLTRQQFLTFNSLTGKTTYQATNSEFSENWKDGEYSLKDASIQELALTLEKVYGVKVTLKSPELQKSDITIQFNLKDNIRDILDQLKLIHHVKYTIKNKEVILMK